MVTVAPWGTKFFSPLRETSILPMFPESVGTVMPNPRTRRIQMVVAASGAEGVGAWQSLMRNVRDDFLRAFGEEPGPLTAVGVLTDTDNTDGHAEAWYGDIRFEPAPH